MKKDILISITASAVITLIAIILLQFIYSIWLNGLLLFCILTLLILLIVNKLKKNYSNFFIQHIYGQLKVLLPQTDNKIIRKMNELDEFITKIIAERKREQEHFKNLDSYRKEYLGNVSHELKTPLFNVQGYIATLLDGGMDDKEILVEYLKKADKNTERMLNIIDDLETISHLESGAMILDYEPFDIEQLICEVFEQMELSAKTKNIQFQLIKESPSSYFIVNADRFRIRQVFINLISNSIKYGKEHGHTTITLKKENEKILVSVADDGIGIDEKHLPRIFERFYRVDKGRSREQGGTGLGLAIVKHIIEAHKQNISVKSQPEKGTIFTFSLESE